MAIMATRGNRITYDLFICVLRNSSSENIIKKIMDQGVITFKENYLFCSIKPCFQRLLTPFGVLVTLALNYSNITL